MAGLHVWKVIFDHVIVPLHNCEYQCDWYMTYASCAYGYPIGPYVNLRMKELWDAQRCWLDSMSYSFQTSIV